MLHKIKTIYVNNKSINNISQGSATGVPKAPFASGDEVDEAMQQLLTGQLPLASARLLAFLPKALRVTGPWHIIYNAVEQKYKKIENKK